MTKIIAMDVDLHKIYAVTNTGDVLAKANHDVQDVIAEIRGAAPTTVLMEISSPVMYIKDPAVVHNVIRWALWNMATACALDEASFDWEREETRWQFLVAPSHVWTKGHNLKLRHDVAGCKHKQKDLRECEAMIFYYQKDPDSWLTLPKYLENL